MNKYQYKEIVNKAYQCGCSKYSLQKTQNIINEQYSKDLGVLEKYEGLSIFEAYMKGYEKIN